MLFIQAMHMGTLIFPGVAVVLLSHLMGSPIGTLSSSANWRSLSIERRLSDAELVVWAKAMIIQNGTVSNETQSMAYLLLQIRVLVSLNPCVCTKDIINGIAEVLWYIYDKCHSWTTRAKCFPGWVASVFFNLWGVQVFELCLLVVYLSIIMQLFLLCIGYCHIRFDRYQI